MSYLDGTAILGEPAPEQTPLSRWRRRLGYVAAGIGGFLLYRVLATPIKPQLPPPLSAEDRHNWRMYT